MNTQKSPPPETPGPRRDLQDERTASFAERLLGYIPADVIAAYMTFTNILADDPNNPAWLHFAMFFALLVLAPIYCVFWTKEPAPALHATRKGFCALASALSFSAWCFAMGGPFATLAWYRPIYGSLVLILTALILPILEKILLKQDPPHDNSNSESHQ